MPTWQTYSDMYVVCDYTSSGRTPAKVQCGPLSTVHVLGSLFLILALSNAVGAIVNSIH